MGKSNFASSVFSCLGKMGHGVELVREYIKNRAYEGRKAQSYEQLLIFSKQLDSEDILLRNGVPLVITDSPVMLSAGYAEHNGLVFSEELVSISKKFDNDFPAINLYIERTVPYQTSGRYHSKDEAEKFDIFLVDFLERNLIDLQRIKVDDLMQVVEMVRKEIE